MYSLVKPTHIRIASRVQPSTELIAQQREELAVRSLVPMASENELVDLSGELRCVMNTFLSSGLLYTSLV